MKLCIFDISVFASHNQVLPRRILYLLIFFIVITDFAIAQDNPTIERVENYNEWGWDSWVMQNSLVTLATVPAIGARIMQYDLAEHKSIFVNPAELGKTYTPPSGSLWPNFGGFKNWPAPQDRWGWPPPPSLDFGAYESDADTHIDSVSLVVTSPVEQWRTPGLRFRRRTTLYRGTSRVKVEQTIINEGSSAQQWSVWDVTQHITNHPGESDFDNFWVYFPINPDSRYGKSGVRLNGASDAWVGEVAPGIYGVRFRPDGKKIFADSHIGWICYVDEREGYVYAKTFDIDESGEYPDEGARVEVWVNNNPYYLEVEVVSPLIDLPANGGSYTFTENWWAAKLNGPVLSVTNAGAVSSFYFEPEGERFVGEFGVFHLAEARLEFFNDSGDIVDSSLSYNVTPLETFNLDESLVVPANADSVRVVLLDENRRQKGVLVSASLSDMTTAIEQKKSIVSLSSQLNQNYPNPFNPRTKISFNINKPAFTSLIIYNALGEEIIKLVDEFKNPGNYELDFDGSTLPSGIYFYKLQTDKTIKTRKMLLLR